MKVAVTPRGTLKVQVFWVEKKKHETGLIGGTFDRFHAGHMSLIAAGLEHCKNIQVWITNDKLARSKDRRIQDWHYRQSDLIDATSEYSSRITTHQLDDKFGPSLKSTEASAIICTADTIQGCLEINSLREKDGFPPLDIISVERVTSWDGGPISSSRIRDGHIDREGMPWIPDHFRDSDLIMTPIVESQLKEPFGELIEGPEEDITVAALEAISRIVESTKFSGPLIAVGDVTVLAFQNSGRPADIALVDGQTKREEWEGSNEINFNLYDNLLECNSPAGYLSRSLLKSCESSISSWMEDGESSIIRVVGEEDLSPLLLHPMAPIGSVVLYGQPGRGLVIRWCDEESKIRCRNLLRGFSVD